MNIPEIQYQPEAPSAPFNPVKAVDINPGLQANQQQTIQGMNANLAQTRADRSTAIQNAKNSIPVDALANFSSSLKTMLDERKEQEKKDIEAEMTMLAFTDGITADPAFNNEEKQLESTGKKIEATANSYEQKTSDVEGAERIRGLSGWKKYYYMKAKAQQAGSGFSGWMSANAENPEMAVNVDGQMYTLASAPTAPIRQAVAAKMAATYMKPYAGLNKSFLGKYMFPGMKQGMTSTINSYAAANAKRINANRLDAAQTNFMQSPDVATSMQSFRAELTAMGETEANIRGKMTDMASQFTSRDKLDQFLNAPYGPNGKSFREQYPQEAQDAVTNFNQLKTSQATNGAQERQIQDLEALEEATQTVLKDREDGTFDANPETLKQFAEQARAAGLNKTAEYWEGVIGQTAAMKNSTTVREQYEMQIQAGVIPSKEEILQNPALSQQDKQKLLGKTQGDGRAEPSAGSMAKGHQKIINDSIRKRGKWTANGANDPGIAAAELRAWSEYKEIYNRELQSGVSESVAAERALSDFKSKFGSKNKEGEYALWGTEDGGAPQDRIGTYQLYDPTGTASNARSPMSQIDELFEASDPNTVLNTHPKGIYEGEVEALENITKSFELTGKVGTIPPVYYELQQRFGGNVSIIDMINKRMEATGQEQLPEQLTTPLKALEESFDEETYKYINYKPNATRTDIGLISSGEEPVYKSSLPTTVASDIEFQQEVSAVAGRLGISEADLYAVMSFETGGSFDPGVRNAAGSGATGLIQFMPATAQGLGTTTEALAKMSRVDQMKYVEKYLSNKGIRGGNLSDLYMSVLFPAAVGKPDNYVLFGRGAMSGYTGSAYSQNRGLDSNGDGSVTKAEASAKVLRHQHAQPWRRPNNMRPELQ